MWIVTLSERVRKREREEEASLDKKLYIENERATFASMHKLQWKVGKKQCLNSVRCLSSLSQHFVLYVHLIHFVGESISFNNQLS